MAHKSEASDCRLPHHSNLLCREETAQPLVSRLVHEVFRPLILDQKSRDDSVLHIHVIIFAAFWSGGCEMKLIRFENRYKVFRLVWWALLLLLGFSKKEGKYAFSSCI